VFPHRQEGRPYTPGSQRANIVQNAAVRFLTIVRHAKAAAHSGDGGDFDRPLTKKGRAQSERLRDAVIDAGVLGQFGPATALVSGAARTRETYALAFAGTPFVHAVEISDLIYNGYRHVSAADALTELASVDPVTESLLLVAHNPTVLELAYALSDREIPALAGDRFPLGAAVVFAVHDGEPIGSRQYRFITAFVPET
jgi:phosphohistidine phosphatase SixA